MKRMTLASENVIPRTPQPGIVALTILLVALLGIAGCSQGPCSDGNYRGTARGHRDDTTDNQTAEH